MFFLFRIIIFHFLLTTKIAIPYAKKWQLRKMYKKSVYAVLLQSGRILLPLRKKKYYVICSPTRTHRVFDGRDVEYQGAV